MKDINDNLSEVYFDVLGLPTAMAVKGKGTEGDNLTGFTDAPGQPGISRTSRLSSTTLTYDEAQARTWLGNATARHVYYFGEIEATSDGTIVILGPHTPPAPAAFCASSTSASLAPGEKSPLQAAFEYSDGMGSVLVKKVQAEPETAGAAAALGRQRQDHPQQQGQTGQAVRALFQRARDRPSLRCEEAGHEEGVTPVIYYDAAGRTVRTEMPDGSFSRVEFSPWHVRTFDQNDTALEPDTAERNAWYDRRMNPRNPRLPSSIRRKTACRTAGGRTRTATPRPHHPRQPGPRGHRHRPQPCERRGRRAEGRKIPHLHQARRRRQAAVDPRCPRQSGDAVHHAAQPPERSPVRPIPDVNPQASCPATTSPAICCSSTAWMPATAGC